MVEDITKFWAGGFLYNPDTHAVLLHKRDNKAQINPNRWAFFGGLSKGNEAPSQTFRREMNEELGIDINESDVIPLCDYLNEVHNTHRYVFFAEGRKEKSDMHLTEGADFDWIPLAEVSRVNPTSYTKRDIELFVKRHVRN